MIEPLDPGLYRDIVRRALDEDVGTGDVTTAATVSPSQRARGVFLVKADCVIAGLEVAFEAFRQVHENAKKGSAPDPFFTAHKQDGEWCRAGEEIAEVTGSGRRAADRRAHRAQFSPAALGHRDARAPSSSTRRAGGSPCSTREKPRRRFARSRNTPCAPGGATNHRAGLFDAVLIKDNHIRLAGGVKAAVDRTRQYRPGLPIEIEAQSLAQVDEALAAGADRILLDNLTLG